MTSPRKVEGPGRTGSGQPGAPATGAADLAGHRKAHRTRLGGLWAGLAVAVVVLLLLLVFILENGQEVSVGYFGAHGHLPLGVALLLAAGAGALLVIIPGTARIMQLRRRHRALENRLSAAAAGVTPPGGAGVDEPPGPPGSDPA